MTKHRVLTASLLSLLLAAPISPRAEESHGHEDIVILSNREFDRAHGVTAGKGTKASPYVFSRLAVNSLTIKDTSRAIKIEDSTIGTLTLNYIGPDVEVTRNKIGDLRVNENVPRTGAPTSGRFVINMFGIVGQIRHFDGRFGYNTVGRPRQGALDDVFAPFNRVVTFDGFNGALFDHNLIYGAMDARLHGHHHSSSFGSGSHMHAGHHDMVDHAVRYHQVRIVANKIVAPGVPYALAYLDTIHSANDRTADSETNPDLEKPHLHRTRVAIAGNTLVGSGLLVDVFNSGDDLHRGMPQGWLSITDNRISLERSALPYLFGPTSGIDVYEARHLSLRVGRNTIVGPGPMSQTAPLREWTNDGEGILLRTLEHADVLLDGNSVSGRRAGIRATRMPRSVRWTIRGLRTSGVEEPVTYDSSVENPPRR